MHNIINLEQWKKQRQASEKCNTTESIETGLNENKFIMPQELDNKYSTENEEIFYSGMIIW